MVNVVSINVDMGRTERCKCHLGEQVSGRSRCVQIRGKLFKTGSYSPSAADKKTHPIGSRIEKRYMAPFFGSLYMPEIISGHTAGVLQTLVHEICVKVFTTVEEFSSSSSYKLGYFIHHPPNTRS